MSLRRNAGHLRSGKQLSRHYGRFAFGIALRNEPEGIVCVGLASKLPQRFRPQHDAGAALAAESMVDGFAAGTRCAVPVSARCRDPRPQEEDVALAGKASREPRTPVQGGLGVVDPIRGQQSRGPSEMKLGSIPARQPTGIHFRAEVKRLRRAATVRRYPCALL